MKKTSLPLGKICDLIKGISPILKTAPGRYPLITTGRDRKTADTFQFDAEAVCIPIVSSTGHGHASLKRVHYQNGKFALGNILVAVIAKKSSVISIKYLERYLNHTKEQLIVPLMTGAANMTISLDRLKTVPIEFPELSEQEQIVEILDEADELRELRAQSDSRTAALIPALFHEMFGDPITNPKGWPRKPLGKICELVNGAPFKPSDWDGAGLPIVRIQNLNDYTKPFNYTSKILPEKFRVKSGDILLSWSGTPGTSFGCFRYNGPSGWLNQHIFNVGLNPEMSPDFFIESVNARLAEMISKAHGGVGLQHITKSALSGIELLTPPLSIQQKFASRVTEIRELAATQAASRNSLEALFQSFLHRAFNGAL